MPEENKEKYWLIYAAPCSFSEGVKKFSFSEKDALIKFILDRGVNPLWCTVIKGTELDITINFDEVT